MALALDTPPPFSHHTVPRKPMHDIHTPMKALFIVFALCTPFYAFSAQPNIILMMGDDHGWEETGYNGHPHVKTPVLDEMAAAGLKFERFYAAHPSCSPTRASFLTGRHPVRMGTFAPGWSLRPEEITSAHLLAKAGYHCMHLGKWHVGAVKAGSPVNPGAMGFHEWLSHDNFFEMNPSLSRNGGPPEVFTGESSEILIREAIACVGRARQADKPLFLIIWFGSPHEPYSGLPQDLALYDDLPAKYPKLVGLTSNETGDRIRRPQGEVLRARYAEITAMDRAIGMLRKQLAETGLRDNTLLFYCGDNGTSPESALGFPHRGAKGEVYEGGTLVPGIIEWPARIPKPRATSVRASTSDLLPTLAALVGQPLPDRPLEGIDLGPVLDGSMTARPSPLAFWDFDVKHLSASKPEPYIDPTLQEGTTPLVKKMGGKATRDFRNLRHPSITEMDYLGPRAIIDGDHKLVIREQKDGTPVIELFDLKTDPAEKDNLIGQKPELSHTLHSKLRQWQDSALKSLTGADYRP
jgi:arylsulfatase A-like enzyme